MLHLLSSLAHPVHSRSAASEESGNVNLKYSISSADREKLKSSKVCPRFVRLDIEDLLGKRVVRSPHYR